MSLLHQAPTFTPKEAAAIAHSKYDLVCLAEWLPSERDQNFLLKTERGEKFVLKIANATEQRSLLDAQNDAMTHLASRLSFCPRVIFTQSGVGITQVETRTAQHYVRLVSYIEGVTFADSNQTPRLLLSLGKRLGEFSRALSDFDRPAFHREFHWDLKNGLKIVDRYSQLISDKELRLQVETFRKRFDSELQLPSGIIHGDANDHNILAHDEEIVGLIDFGDMVFSYRVGELAIALAYIVLDKTDPLTTAKLVVAGYLSEVRLNHDEIEALWTLMLMRLCMSICIAEHQSRQKPENEYLDISQRAIRSSLPRLLAIDSRDVFLSTDYADYADFLKSIN